MARELKAYRDNLEDILEFTGGKRLLNYTDVSRYTGKHQVWVRKTFKFTDGVISAPTLARRLAEGY